MANYNKSITATSIRLGEVRFSYAWVLSPKTDDDGKEKYSAVLLIPKTDTQAVNLVKNAIEAAKQAGITAGKLTDKKTGRAIPDARLKIVNLRDGDEEYPGDPTYEGMWYLNTASYTKPGVRILENGQMSEAMDADDFYSGCWGAAVVNFYAFSNQSVGIACALNNVIKTRDDEKLGGGNTAEDDFGDMVSEGNSFLD